jgi:hypothetical protein
MGFRTAIDFGRNRRRFPDFPVQCRLFPLENKTFPDAIDGVHMHVQPFGYLPAGQTPSLAPGIAPEQHLRVANLFGWSTPISRNRFQSIALLWPQAHNVLLRHCTSIPYPDCHPWHSSKDQKTPAWP